MNEIEIKTDCFAYCKDKNGCRALCELYCATEKCRFYKTKEQRKEELKNSRVYCG